MGLRTSLLAQWLRLWAPNAGDPGSIPGQGTRSHMLHATKTLLAKIKTQQSQVNKYLKRKKKKWIWRTRLWRLRK